MKKKFGVLVLSGLMACSFTAGVGLFGGSAQEIEPITFVYDTDYLTMEQNASYADDTGKTGVKFTSVKSGTAAEGTSFDIQNSFTGNFELDFRVTSQNAYEGMSATDGWTHYITNTKQKYSLSDYMNPYLDLKEVAFTFKSNTNENAYFTVYVRGAHSMISWTPTARVYVAGDNVYINDEIEEKHYGYGLNASGVYKTEGWSYMTEYQSLPNLYGTSFCNYHATASGNKTAMTTVSNMIKFDPSEMKVYVNGSDGYRTNAEADMLLRDMATNEGFVLDDSRTTPNSATVPATLNAEDFAGGYTVSVQYTDVTANETVGDGQYFGGEDHYAKIIETPYDRYATLNLYSINGVEMTEENVNTVVDQYKVARTQSSMITADSDVVVTENKTNAIDNRAGINIRSAASGTAAEGAGFGFADKMLGDFEIDFRVTSKNTYAPLHDSDGWTHYIQNGNQKYMFSDNENPYLDLKEVAFTFTSATDPDKYFIVYFYGAHGDLAFATTAYVYVPGDKCYKTDEQGNFRYGYALSKTGEYPVQGMGHLQDYRNMPTIYGTSFSNFSATSSKDVTAAKTVPNMLRFDTEEMKIYVNAGTNYSTPSTETNYLVRDIATNAGASSSMIVGSLNAEDFANGYTVSVTFTDVTANETVGDAQNFGGVDHYVKPIETAYERYADMTVYKINGQSVEYTSATSGKLIDKTAPIVGLIHKNVGVDAPVDLTPFFYDSAIGNTIGGYGNVSVSTDGETYAVVEKTDDGYVYTPTAYGTMYVKYEDFKDAVGNVAETKIFALERVDYILPELAFKDGVAAEMQYDKTAGFAARPVFALDDVVIKNSSEIKTYVTEIVEVKDPDGQTYHTTVLSFLKDGTYSVTYRVTDNFGNSSTIVRTVAVSDYSAPVLTVKEALSATVGQTVDISVTEMTDFGAVTLSVTVSKDGKNYFVGTEAKPFKATEVGVYTITYKATDEMGLTTEKTATLTVTEATSAPETPKDDPSAESGCAAAVNGLPIATLMLLGVAVALKKRKQA